MIVRIPVVQVPHVALSVYARPSGRLGRRRFDVKIEFGYSGNSGDKNAGPKGVLWRVKERDRVIVCVKLAVKHQIVSNLGNIKCPVKARVTITWHRGRATRGLLAKKAVNEIARSQRGTSASPNCHSAPEAELKVWQRLKIDLVAVNEWVWNKRTALKLADKLINAERPEIL